MLPNTHRLNTPQNKKAILKSYQRKTLVEVAAEFHAAHSTIKEILISQGIKIRKRGEHTDDTKIHIAAARCASLLRYYPTRLHKEILIKLKEYLK